MKLEVWFDASHNSFTKTCGLGIYITDGNNINYKYQKHVSEDSNEAEMKALTETLNLLVTQYRNYNEVTIYGDSKSVIEHINGINKIKDKLYIESKLKLTQKLKLAKNTYKSLEIKWIPRTENREANYISQHGELMPVQCKSKPGKKKPNAEDNNVIFLRLHELNVPRMFKYSSPSVKTIEKVMNYYKEHDNIDKPIVIRKDKTIVDNYTRYLVAKHVNLRFVPVVYENIN